MRYAIAMALTACLAVSCAAPRETASQPDAPAPRETAPVVREAAAPASAPVSVTEPAPKPAPVVKKAPPPLEPRELPDLETFVNGPVKLNDVEKMAEAIPDRATVRPKKDRKLLIYTRCKGFRHGAIPFGSTALKMMGVRTGAYETVVSDDPLIFAADSLAKFDVICMNNTTGELFEGTGREDELKASLMDFVKSGKGIIGIHAATDCSYKWPEYGDMMGGYFWGHPWSEEVGVKLDDPEHTLLAAYKGKNFIVTDEIYQFKDPYSRDNLRVLLSLDPSNTKVEKGKRSDGDFAVAWCRSFGKGRVFYFSLGHQNAIFWTPDILKCYLDGLQFASGDLEADTTPRPLTVRQIDQYMGEYVGTFKGASGATRNAEAKVFPQGGGSYKAVLLTGDPGAGQTRIVLVAGASGGASAGSRIDVRRTDSPDGPKGVNYSYYEGDWSSLPDFDDLTPKKTGEADYFGIGPRDRNDQFAFKFTGFVKATETGRYTFATTSDDGSAIYIGGKRVVNNDGLHGMDEKRGEIVLKKGMHPITVVFFEGGGGEGLDVKCSAKPEKVVEGEDEEEAEGEGLALAGSADGVRWKARIVGDDLVATAKGAGGGRYELKYAVRKSPTELKPPPAGATVVLAYEKGEAPSLDGWKNESWTALADGSMEVGRRSNLTKREFGDATYHIEFRIPYVPARKGQDRGNSGVYFQDRYEVQVLDSFGLVQQSNDCGGIYKIASAKVNACLPPMAWQTYDVRFRAPRFGADGKVSELPRITVRHNGIVIHEDQELPHSTTASGSRGHAKTGPIHLQDHGHKVRYRNIWVVEE